MRKLITIVAASLLLAACGGQGGEAADTTAGGTDTVADVTTTAAAEPSTSAEVETTTTAAETVTTEGGTSEDGTSGLSAFFDNVRSADEVTSARIEGVMEMVGVEGLGDVSLPFGSIFDLASGNSSITMDMSALAGSVEGSTDDGLAGLAGAMMGEFEIRQIGDRAYMRMPFVTAMLGTDAEWVSMPADEAGDFSSDMGVQTDPYEMLEDYRDANAQVDELGTESVNGVDATHYHVVVDAEQWLATLSDEERAELEADGPIPLAEFPMDLWISEEGYVVRMIMEIDGSAVEDDTTDDSFEMMTITYDVFDINQPVEITAPEEFVDMDELGGFGLENN